MPVVHFTKKQEEAFLAGAIKAREKREAEDRRRYSKCFPSGEQNYFSGTPDELRAKAAYAVREWGNDGVDTANALIYLADHYHSPD